MGKGRLQDLGKERAKDVSSGEHSSKRIYTPADPDSLAVPGIFEQICATLERNGCTT